MSRLYSIQLIESAFNPDHFRTYFLLDNRLSPYWFSWLWNKNSPIQRSSKSHCPIKGTIYWSKLYHLWTHPSYMAKVYTTYTTQFWILLHQNHVLYHINKVSTYNTHTHTHTHTHIFIFFFGSRLIARFSKEISKSQKKRPIHLWDVLPYPQIMRSGSYALLCTVGRKKK